MHTKDEDVAILRGREHERTGYNPVNSDREDRCHTTAPVIVEDLDDTRPCTNSYPSLSSFPVDASQCSNLSAVCKPLFKGLAKEVLSFVSLYGQEG